MERCGLLSIMGLVLVTHAATAQSSAAVDRVQQGYTSEQMADLQEHGHYKYVGLLLYFSSSFQVLDQGQYRPPTEEEIALIDLQAYDGLRRTVEDVEVLDPLLGAPVLLFSRDRFEQVLIDALNEVDLADYLRYRTKTQRRPTHKTE